jgi:hypothetical protein
MIQILYKHENTDGWSKEHMILPTHLTLTPSLPFLAFFLDLSLNFLHVIFFVIVDQFDSSYLTRTRRKCVCLISLY